MTDVSPFPDVDIPDLSLPAMVLGDAAQHGGRTALIDAGSGDAITYAQLADNALRLAKALRAEGLRPGAVLALCSPNTVRFPVVFHAAQLAGLTVTTVSALYTVSEVAHQLRDSRAVAIVTVAALLDTTREAARAAGVSTVLVTDEAEGCRSVSEAVAGFNGTIELPDVAPDDVAVLPYSSGTTGAAKGVMLTHHNLVANLVQNQALLRHGPEDVLLAVLPFSHIYGMQVLMNSGLTHGATVVTMPRFDLSEFLQAIQEHHVTRVYVAPPVLVAVAKDATVGSYDLSSLRAVHCGAAPLDADLAAAAAARLGVPVSQAYGMTELSPITHATPFGTDPVPGSIGKLAPLTRARIVDPVSGEDAAVGARGELWVQGPQVMRGYLNRPDETAAVIDGSGWLRTGDVAIRDDDGNYFIVDRIKELIKYKGYQVAPAELEAELLTNPRIADVAVVGVELDGDEVPKAYVVRSDSELTESEVMAYLSGRVAPYKRVRLVEFVDLIPKSPSGKILRRQLREREER